MSGAGAPREHVNDVLKDGEIRAALVSYLEARVPRPKKVIHELRVSRGNAIADLVALYKVPHCYEIKGHTDSVRRVLRQAEFYNCAFRLVTLVTTQNHRGWSERHLPDFWGIIVAKRTRRGVVMEHVRSASHNANFDPFSALAPLWRDELLVKTDALVPGWARAAHTRNDLAQKICEVSSSRDVLNYLTVALESRKATQRS